VVLSFASIVLVMLFQDVAENARDPGQGETTVFVSQADDDERSQDSAVYISDLAAGSGVPKPGENRTVTAQLPAGGDQGSPMQLTEGGASAEEVSQLSEKDGGDPLAQLTEAERQVVLRAVQGTDICERDTEIEAIAELCRRKLEYRSEEFAVELEAPLSPEERLLGEGLAGDRIATLERAIARLARGGGDPNSQENQAIASIALSPGASLEETVPSEKPTDGQLSLETQALINAIVEQFSGQGSN
jgi:hypothetical protein